MGTDLRRYGDPDAEDGEPGTVVHIDAKAETEELPVRFVERRKVATG